MWRLEKEYLMKIALINENSQAAKNEMICATLKKVVEPMGHEVFNYGMCGAEDPNSLTYVQNGILAAVLLNSGAAPTRLATFATTMSVSSPRDMP